MQSTVKLATRWLIRPLLTTLAVAHLVDGAHAAPECLADFDPAPYASGCGSVQVPAAAVRGGDTLSVEIVVGEDPTGPCGVGTYRISASYALDAVLLDGVPVVATQHGDAGTYDYGSPDVKPVSGPVIVVPPGRHTVVFSLQAHTPDDCVRAGVDRFSGERLLAGPWVVLSQDSGRWSTPVPFVTASAATCGDGAIDLASEQCDPPDGACDFDCQCASTCGNSRIEEPCEQCDPPGRSCSNDCRCVNTCGDGKVERPCETCDLGAARNGRPGSGCSNDCQVTGTCSGTGATCATMADCPEGEHCCGNARYELGEQCDDGNRFDLDCCSSSCRNESTGEWGRCDDGETSCTSSADCPAGEICHSQCVADGCAAFGPHVVPLSSRFVALLSTDPDEPRRLQVWASKGSFTLPAGARFAPDAQYVGLDVVDTGGIPVTSPSLLPAWCPPASTCFTSPAEACPRRWVFYDPQDAVSLAQDMEWARFVRTATPEGRCKRRIKFALQSNDDAQAILPRSSRLRQTIEVGDLCATTLLECTTVSGVGIDCLSLR